MKKTILSLFFVIGSLTVAQIAISFSGGPPAGVAGDGTASCISGGCHSGQLISDAQLSLVNDVATETYVPGQTYTFTITNGGQSSGQRGGFQLVILDRESQRGSAGTITAGANQRMQGSGTRVYLNHNTPSSTGIWSFTWQAPATDVGPLDIYLTAHSGPSRSQSQVRRLQVTLQPDVASSLANSLESVETKVFPNPAAEYVVASFKLNKTSAVKADVVDLNGRTVVSYNLGSLAEGEHKERLQFAGQLNKGVYFLRLSAGNSLITKNFVVI